MWVAWGFAEGDSVGASWHVCGDSWPAGCRLVVVPVPFGCCSSLQTQMLQMLVDVRGAQGLWFASMFLRYGSAQKVIPTEPPVRSGWTTGPQWPAHTEADNVRLQACSPCMSQHARSGNNLLSGPLTVVICSTEAAAINAETNKHCSCIPSRPKSSGVSRRHSSPVRVKPAEKSSPS